MPHSPDTYLRQLAALLPRGRLFSELGPNLTSALESAAEEFARVDTRADDAYAEQEPGTATETLDQWEGLYGLPSDGTTEQRRQRAAARRYKRSRCRPIDYRERLSGILGLPPADLPVIEFFNGTPAVTSDQREHYRFCVYRDPYLSGTYSVADAQALVDDYSQSHVRGRIIESLAAKCDDPYSLTDRDPLGGSTLYIPAGALALHGGFLVTGAGGFLEI